MAQVPVFSGQENVTGRRDGQRNTHKGEEEKAFSVPVKSLAGSPQKANAGLMVNLLISGTIRERRRDGRA